MKRIILALFISIASGAALAGNNGPGTETCQGSTCSPGGTTGGTASATSSASSSATGIGVGVGVGIGVGIGGDGGKGGQGGQGIGYGGAGGVGNGGQGGQGGSASAGGGAASATNGGVSVENKALSFGGSGLAASSNACQGSTAIGPLSSTRTIDFCRKLAVADGMRASGFSTRSQQRVLCQIEEVAEAEECQALAKPSAPVAVGVQREIVMDQYAGTNVPQ